MFDTMRMWRGLNDAAWPRMVSADEAVRELSVAMPARIDGALQSHLLQRPREEDLCFALWSPSAGERRTTAMLHTVVLPLDGEREVHGNASFHPHYLERVLALAMEAGPGVGVAFLHSHIAPGWQDMSPDDVIAERERLAGMVGTMTDLPLVGLTLGTDGTWSARCWEHDAEGELVGRWCESVRVSGRRLKVSFTDALRPKPSYREEFRRTRTVYGIRGHQQLARLRVGVVGVGSVGMAMVEQLARAGIERVTFIDFDKVERHNLDRLQGTDVRRDVGRQKVDAAGELFARSSTASWTEVRRVAHSVVEQEGYRAALDCDVLFCCVDRPRARQILNYIAYAHLIPVIDGGIAIRLRSEEGGSEPELLFADWQVQTVGPGRPCLECLGQFTGELAELERSGMLDDPSYMEGLPPDHDLKQNENVYGFSIAVASLEWQQFLGLAGGMARADWFGVQRHHFVAGITEADDSRTCKVGCGIEGHEGVGDRWIQYWGRDAAAERARAKDDGAGGRV